MYSEQKQITYQDSMNLDAFSRLRTSGTGQRLDVEFIYDKQEEIMDEIIVGAGTVVHQANSRDLILAANSTTNGDKATMQSFPIPYTPGNSQLVAMTGTLNEAGIVGGDVEIFMRTKVTGSVVTTTYDQTTWNIDTVTDVDWETSQIFIIDFQSLKVGRIRFGLDRGGIIVPVHTITNDNLRATGYWQLPTLPVCWSIYNDATDTYCEIAYGDSDNAIGFRFKVTANASTTLRAICATVKSEGGLNLSEIPGYNRAADMGVTRVTVGTTLIPLLSIRPKATFNSLPNNGLIIPETITIDGDNPVKLVIVHNASLVGASWVDVDTTQSMQEYDISATSFSNGHEVHVEYFGTSKNSNSSKDGILGKTLLWDRKGTETGTLTICAVRTTATSSDVLVSINSKEIR